MLRTVAQVSQERYYQILSKLKREELVNASVWVGLSNLIAITAVFVVQKVIAIQLGPAGVAIIGQYQSFLGMTSALATGGISNGVVKYVAEYRQDINRNANLISNAMRITLAFSGLVAVVLLLFASPLSLYLFQADSYSSILRLLAVTITLFSLNQMLISVLNGFGEIKKYAGSAIARSMVSFLLMVVLSLIWDLVGALIALTVVQSLVFFVTLFFVIRSPWFTKRFFLQAYDFKYTKLLFAFSLMTLTSAIVVPLVQILIRNYLIVTLSLEQAGFWDAVRKISQGYLGIFTGTLSVYYLPKLSRLQSVVEIRREIWKGYKIFIPILLVVLTTIFVLRYSIVLLLYSEEFLLTTELFLPMLIGDFFKIITWLIAHLMVAKAKIKMFIATEISFYVLTYILTVVLVNQWGLVGSVWAHSASYLTYFIISAYLLREYLFERYEARTQ